MGIGRETAMETAAPLWVVRQASARATVAGPPREATRVITFRGGTRGSPRGKGAMTTFAVDTAATAARYPSTDAAPGCSSFRSATAQAPALPSPANVCAGGSGCVMWAAPPKQDARKWCRECGWWCAYPTATSNCRRS